MELITAKASNLGTATIRVYEKGVGTLVQTQNFILTSASTQWQVPQRITDLDPTKRYYMQVTAADGKPIVVEVRMQDAAQPQS